jgi:hypothetical protein
MLAKAQRELHEAEDKWLELEVLREEIEQAQCAYPSEAAKRSSEMTPPYHLRLRGSSASGDGTTGANTMTTPAAAVARDYGTPAAVIDMDRVERNIARIQRL